MAQIGVGIVAGIQALILVVEMFFWLRPVVHERLNFNQEEAQKADPIVKNAGLYNGFLAAGLIWSLAAQGDAFHLQVFFLTCVITAGLFGAITLKPTTLILQTAPATVALALVYTS